MNHKCLKFILGLLEFKTIKDTQNNEYVLFKNNPIDSIDYIEDKTLFEASENHIHICDRVKRRQYRNLTALGDSLGKILLNTLKITYPKKKFVVYITLTLNDSMIIRFHQIWENESLYYEDVKDSPKEKIMRFIDQGTILEEHRGMNTEDDSVC